MHKLFLFVFVLTACSGSENNSVVAILTDTLPGGVIRVTNQGLPPLADAAHLHLVEIGVIDPADDSPGMLGGPGQMAFDSEGNLFVVVNRPSRVLVFDSAGSFLRSFGREGDGPGELMSMGGNPVIWGDTVMIHQAGGRISWFTRSGEALSEARTSATGRFGAGGIIRDHMGRIWLEGVALDPVTRPPQGSTGSPFNGPGWLRMDSWGEVLDSLGLPRDASLPTLRYWTAKIQIGGEIASGSTPVPYQVELAFSPRHDGNLVLGRNDGGTLHISRDGKDTLRLIVLPLPTTAMSDADRLAALRQAAPEGSPFAQTAKVEDLPRNWPRFTGLMVDLLDRTWLLVPGAGRPDAELWMVSPEGELVTRFPAPDGQLNRAAWSRDRLAVPDESEEGRPVIRIYRLENELGRNN